VIGADGERHQQVERHAVLGIDVEQLRRDRGELQPLLHDLRADEEARRDVLDPEAAVGERLKCPELVERVQVLALDVLGQAVLFGRDGRAGLAGVARHRDGLRQALGPDEHL